MPTLQSMIPQSNPVRASYEERESKKARQRADARRDRRETIRDVKGKLDTLREMREVTLEHAQEVASNYEATAEMARAQESREHYEEAKALADEHEATKAKLSKIDDEIRRREQHLERIQ